MTTYTPTVWADGDTITAAKLNKIENRIAEIQEYNIDAPEPIVIDISTSLTQVINLTPRKAQQYLNKGILIPVYITIQGSGNTMIDYICGIMKNNGYGALLLFHNTAVIDASSMDSDFSITLRLNEIAVEQG